MSIRIKIHADGTATLSGIPYQRLREALVSASLQCREGQPGIEVFKPDAKILAYHLELLKWVELMHSAMELGIKNTWPKRDLPLTKKERFEKVRESEKERAMLARWMEQIREKHHKRA